MLGAVPRAAVAALAGGAIGALVFAVVFVRSPRLAVDMDRDLPPRVASGFYPVEREGDTTFAWTSRRADLTLAGLDRDAGWACTVRLRGGRPGGVQQPRVSFSADGVTIDTRDATNEYEEVQVTAPSRAGASGLTFTILAEPPFVPGPTDRRELGVQIDRLACEPATSSIVRPPWSALRGAAIGSGAFASAFSLIGMTLHGALAGTAIVAVGQALPLASGPAPYSGFAQRLVWIAAWIALAAVAGVAALERWRGERMHPAARFVTAFSAGALFLELLAVLHPWKEVVDAVFHAHRLEWVLDGRYYFTQAMPGGVRFPYAIGLYLAAAPWSSLTSDYVTLLRVVVGVAHAFAGCLLYPMIARAWRARFAAAAAVVLFHLVPLPYIVIGNANLTYAFGQSAALVALAAAATWALTATDRLPVLGLFALTSVALLSHVGIVPLLLATLAGMAALYRLAGGAAMRAPSRWIVVAAGLAAVFSVVTYYGHFGEVYRTLPRVRAVAAVEMVSPDTGQGVSAPEPASMPLPRRVGRALWLTLNAVGWPIALLACAGAWRLWSAGARDRLGLAIVACGAAYLAFVAFRVAAPVAGRFQRYADEYIDRVNYGTLPAIVILAAVGFAWGWRAGLPQRLVTAALFAAALVGGVQRWSAWFAS
jgi:hypothetical protein